jgi:hypothetical protein
MAEVEHWVDHTKDGQANSEFILALVRMVRFDYDNDDDDDDDDDDGDEDLDFI